MRFLVMIMTDCAVLPYAADQQRVKAITEPRLKFIEIVLMAHIMPVQNYMALASELRETWDIAKLLHIRLKAKMVLHSELPVLLMTGKPEG